jgi:hypothetical protein
MDRADAEVQLVRLRDRRPERDGCTHTAGQCSPVSLEEVEKYKRLELLEMGPAHQVNERAVAESSRPMTAVPGYRRLRQHR